MPQSAGTITVTGASYPISMQPSEYTFEVPGAGGPHLFQPGATLVAYASGGVVPAFSNIELIAPSDLVFTLPAADTSGASIGVGPSYTIDSSEDLQLEWTGGEIGTRATINISSSSGTQLLTNVWCDFDATAQRGTIPQQLIARFAGVPDVMFSESDYRVTSFQAGTFSTAFEAVNETLGTAVVF